MNEKDFEDIVSKYPEIIEEGLELEARQLTILGRRIDLLFRDTFGRKLLIELKVGPIKDEHVGQILAYEGLILSADYPTLRIMLIANRVPPNIRRSLDHHGIAWREVSLLQLRDFLSAREDQILLRTLEDGKGIKTNDALRKRRSYPKDRQEKSVEISSYRTLSRLFGSRLRAKAIAWFFTHNKEVTSDVNSGLQ
ncbi:MAG: endonuclease NucS domain-containing protein [Syntrophorhabdus sp.]